MTVITAAALLLAGFALFRLWRQKKEIYAFTELLEENLDALLTGKPLKKDQETKDTLAGKVNEKLARIQHIQERKAKESLEAKEQMKELISDISHQTRTPIANQKIYLEILRQQELPREVYGFLDKLEHQTDKLDFLFQSLVKMSRLETGVIQIQKKNCDLAETLKKAVSAVVAAASAKQIRILAEAEGPFSLPHDPKWTEEAVFNLLDNAVKYTEPGGRIWLAVKKGEIFAEIHVKDSGKGILLERQAEIFTRFYREPEVHDAEGIGVGLYLTRRIIELQNGYVDVRSEPGEGSDFGVYLPLQPGT